MMSSSSSSSSLSCLRMMMAVMMMMMMVVVSNAIMSSVIVCPNDHDCEVTCSPYTRNCYNTVIKCPMSTNSTTYNCTVYCPNTVACVGTTIESTDAVSTLYVLSYMTHACENMNIIADGTETVKVTCGGYACTNVNVTVDGAELVALQATFGGDLQTSGIYNGRLNISNTKEVSVYCDYWGCSQTYWFINHVNNFNWKCFNHNSCNNNVVQIDKSANVVIDVMSQYIQPSSLVMLSSQINISDVGTVTMNIMNGTVNGSILVKNTKNFLYKTGPTADPIIKWDVQNVTNIALGSWNATSYWIVEGIPIQKQYICPDGRDCYIRVDANLPNDSISVICPTDSVEKGIQTTCQFYCSSPYSACGMFDLQMKDVTNVGLYFSNKFWYMPLSLNASAYGLANVDTAFNLVCGMQSCINTTANIAGYSTITILSNINGMDNSTMMITDAKFVHLQSNYEGGPSYLSSKWDFSNIDRVQIDCSNTDDCSYSNFHSVNVNDVSVTCEYYYYAHSPGCLNTIFNMSENASFNLTCAGDYISCYNMVLQYNGSKPDDTSFQMTCAIPDNPYTYICYNISIRVTDNKIGYDALNFRCPKNSEGDLTCEDINVYCGDGDWCSCPVKYSSSKDDWYCDGECGTESCPTNHNGLSVYTIAAIVLACFLVTLVGLILFVRRYCCKKKKDDKEGLLGTRQNNYA